MQTFLKNISRQIGDGDLSGALAETKNHSPEEENPAQKIRCYLLLLNQKFPEADALATKLLKITGLDHELLVWRGIARSELGLWTSSLKDLRLSADLFPQEIIEERIRSTTYRACQSLSEGMQLDGGSFNDFLERAGIYLLAKDFARAERDLKLADSIDPDSPSILLPRAKILLLKGANRESLLLIERLLAKKEDDLDAKLLLACAKSETGNQRSALTILRKLTRQKSSEEEVLFKIGFCRMAIRDFHGAINEFDRVLQLNKKSIGAYFHRGVCFAEIRCFDQAVDDLSSADGIEGKNATICAALGNALISKSELKKASRAFKRGLKLEPRCMVARLGLARLKQSRGETAEGLKIATDLLKKNPQSAEILHFVGGLHFQEKEYQESISCFGEAIQHSKSVFQKAGNYYSRGTAELEKGLVAEALADFDTALKLRPGHVGTLVWRGYAAGKSGKWAAAIADLQSAMDINPLAAEQYSKFGELIAGQAIQYFASVIEKNGNESEAFYNRGMAHLFLEEFEQANNDFNKTLSLDPNHPQAQIRLGILRLIGKEAKSAYNHFSAAMKSRPSVTSLLLRADAMLQLGVMGPALLEIRSAINLAGNNDRLYVRRGQLYMARQSFGKAVDDFTLSIALNFDNYQAFRERARLLVCRGEFEEAIADFTMSLHFNSKQPELLTERGKALLVTGQYSDAAADFEMALTSQFSIPTDSKSEDELQRQDFAKNDGKKRSLSNGHLIDAFKGRAIAMSHLGEGSEALIWLTKAIHRFSEKEDWAHLIKARADIFQSLGRFERASADARIVSKLTTDDKVSAECYYLRSLASFYHDDRDHSEKTLIKALHLNPEHADAEQALDWLRNLADTPPAVWRNAPEKIRPTRPGVTGEPLEVSTLDQLGAKAPFDLWLVKSAEDEFGPVPLKTVVSWAKEGRLTAQSQLFRTDWGKWQSVLRILREKKI